MSPKSPAKANLKVVTTVIVGAGFSGIGAAVRLKEAGIEDFIILERAAEIGGTWRDNSYPGIACDVPSLLYSFSWDQNPDWSTAYAGGREIHGYLDSIVERYDLRRHIDFGQSVTGMVLDEAQGVWHVTTDSSTYLARTVIQAGGPLADHKLPDIKGFDEFEGKVIHTARWDHDFDFTGKSVAVIGTGSTAVQVIPELVDMVGKSGRVKVFQRTAGWVVPRANVAMPEVVKSTFRKLPLVQRGLREAAYWSTEPAALALVWNTVATTAMAAACKAYLNATVEDPWLRRELTPQFRPGCKRMLLSSDYFVALQRDNCELVTWPMDRICAEGIRVSDGLIHTFDVIVCATGYDVHKFGTTFDIVGLGGRLLQDEWKRGAYAYKSVSVAGYPNLFLTFGPNSGPGHTSAVPYMEAQIDYAVEAIKMIVNRDLKTLDVKREAQDAHNEDLQKRLAKTTWNSGCSSWYLTEDGFNPSMYPGFATQFRRQLRHVELADYRATGSLPSMAELVNQVS